MPKRPYRHAILAGPDETGTTSRSGGFSLVETMLVVGITSVVAAIAMPMMSNTIADYKLRSDARSLANTLSLTKLRAASDFSQARLFVDRTAKSFHLEKWQKTGTPGWVTEGAIVTLNSNDAFGFGVVGTPPPASQNTIGQASACLTASGAEIVNTSCVLFNSRGIPVTPSGVPPNVGAPTASHALYITDGLAVYGLTVSATGLIKLWRTNPTATPSWKIQ